MSNTYRRKYQLSPSEKQNYSKYELLYAHIATKIMRHGNVHPQSIIPLAKFLAAFVWLFSWPYDGYKKLRLMAKIRKAQHKQ